MSLNLIDIFHFLSCFMSQKHVALSIGHCLLHGQCSSCGLCGTLLLVLLIPFFCRLTVLCPVIQCMYSSRLSSHSLFSPWAVSSKLTASNTIYVSVIFSILLPVQAYLLSSRSICLTSYSKLGTSNLTC